MKKFLSCDWGTSSFRLRLIDAESMKVLAAERGDRGIAATYADWLQVGSDDEQKRLEFYLDVIGEYINKIEAAQSTSLEGVPLILSGMASSSIGMANLPYRELPFHIDGSDAGVELYKERKSFKHPVLLITGLKSDQDVMRGEETQLIGCVAEEQDALGDRIYIFPGTHSKHILVRDKQLVGFKTYMTGEFFELLSKKSILSAGVEKMQDQVQESSLRSFQQGVQDAVGANLLHASFLVRTNDLFGRLSKKDNYSYLSGLLIGTELQELIPLSSTRIYLCAGHHLKQWYENALQGLGLQENVHTFPAALVDESVIRGQFEIYKHFKGK